MMKRKGQTAMRNMASCLPLTEAGDSLHRQGSTSKLGSTSKGRGRRKGLHLSLEKERENQQRYWTRRGRYLWSSSYRRVIVCEEEDNISSDGDLEDMA